MFFGRKKQAEKLNTSKSNEEYSQPGLEERTSIVIASLEEMNVGDAYHIELPDHHIPITPEFTHPRLHTGEITKVIGEQLEGAEPFEVEAGEIVTNGRKRLLRKTGSRVLYVVRNRIVPVLHRAPHVDVHPAEESEPISQSEVPTKYRRHRITSLFLAQKAKLKGHPESWYVAAEYELGRTDEETPGHSDR